MKLDKGKRIVGADRAAVSESFAERYASGESIRSLAAESGRSYGFVQSVLKDAAFEAGEALGKSVLWFVVSLGMVFQA